MQTGLEVKKLVDRYIRWEYTKRQVKQKGTFKYLGLTSMPWGPPVSLDKSGVDRWHERMVGQLRECVSDIILPHQQGFLARGIDNFNHWKEGKGKKVGDKKLDKYIEIGVERARYKWRKRGFEVDRQPVSVGVSLGELEANEIGILKRGELDKGEVQLALLNKKSGSEKDLYRILALGIYGKSKFRKLVFRSIDKYMKWYDRIESSVFIPHWGRLCNGDSKWISSWYMQRALIFNRDLCISVYELSLISIIYDMNVRVYAECDGFREILWKTSRNSTHVINIQSEVDNRWTLLEYQNGIAQKDSKILASVTQEDKIIHNSKLSWSTISSEVDSKCSECRLDYNGCIGKEAIWDRGSKEDGRHLEVDNYLTHNNTHDSGPFSREPDSIQYKHKHSKIVSNVKVESSFLDERKDTNSIVVSSLTSSIGSELMINTEVDEVRREVHDSIDIVNKHVTRQDSCVSGGEDIEYESRVDNRNILSDSCFSLISSEQSSVDITHSIKYTGNLGSHQNLGVSSGINSDWSEVTEDNDLEDIRQKVNEFYDKDNSGDGNNRKAILEVVNGRYLLGDNLFSGKPIIERIDREDSKGLDKNKVDLKQNIINSTHRSSYLGWSLVTANTEEEQELLDIEDNLNRLDLVHKQFKLQPHNTYSNKDSQAEEREQEKISKGIRDKEVDIDEEEIGGKLELGELEVKERDNLSGKSYSTIDEDLKWLFEEKDASVELVASVSEGSEGIGNKNYSYVRGTNHYKKLDRVRTYIKNKNRELTRRRIFWCKWRNKMRGRERKNNRKEDREIRKAGTKQKNIEAVFDYSSRGLEKAEIELLSKGSTFCIANNKIDEDRFKADFYAYSRRLRLHEEFREQDEDYSQIFSQLIHNEEQSQTEETNSQVVSQPVKKVVKRRLPSTYDPDSENRNLARYVNCIQEESIIAIKKKIQFKDNLDKEHRLALRTLKQKVEDKNIIITLADKGSGIVVVDYDKYVEKGTEYIEREAKAYSLTDKPHKQIIADIVKDRNKIVKKLREVKVIEVETATYCMKQLEEKVTGMKFYYKVHKDTKIDTMPLRPLQSCIGSPTQHLSQVLTDLLQPFLNNQYIPTFIQDSNQLLFRLEGLGILDECSTLISSDVAALYPSIPHREGLAAVKTFLEESSNFNVSQIKYIMLALQLVITQNFVMWDGKIYTQDSGVAMGTPVAVAYANIFMHWIDTQLRQRVSYIVEHIRYIDDNLFIIPEDKIEETMNIANNILPPHIRFTYEKLDKQADVGLPFLDTQLFISKEGRIMSRLYTKKTDKHTYLLPSSFHPSHITKNIPQAVFNRIRRICSSIDWFRADAAKAMQWLEDRGYKCSDIVRAVEKSSQKDRWDMINRIEQNRGIKLLEDKYKEVVDIPLIVTFTHNGRLVKEVLKNRQPLLDASFSKTKVRPRLAYRRQRNISDILIQKGLRKPIKGDTAEEFAVTQCGSRPRYRIPCPCKGNHEQGICRCCAHLKMSLDNIKVKLYRTVSCESKNLVYILGCNLCKKWYVGETQQQLKERFLQHLNNIQKLSQPLYTHFQRVHKPENIFVSVLETVNSSDHAYRKIREAWWINRLQTLEPKGFNIKLDCNQIYQEDKSRIQKRRSNVGG